MDLASIRSRASPTSGKLLSTRSCLPHNGSFVTRCFAKLGKTAADQAARSAADKSFQKATQLLLGTIFRCHNLRSVFCGLKSELCGSKRCFRDLSVVGRTEPDQLASPGSPLPALLQRETQRPLIRRPLPRPPSPPSAKPRHFHRSFCPGHSIRIEWQMGCAFMDPILSARWVLA